MIELRIQLRRVAFMGFMGFFVKKIGAGTH